MRNHSALLILALIVAAGCGGPAAEVASAPADDAPIKSPDFRVESLAKPGTYRELSDFEGKVVVLDFWATWCGPCRQYMPIIQEVHDRYKDKGLEIVALSTEERPVVERFEKKRKYTYPVYLDVMSNTSQGFGVTALPTLAVLNRKGEVVFFASGPPPSALREAIEKAL